MLCNQNPKTNLLEPLIARLITLNITNALNNRIYGLYLCFKNLTKFDIYLFIL